LKDSATYCQNKKNKYFCTSLLFKYESVLFILKASIL
jgi:hypothetical protein